MDLTVVYVEYDALKNIKNIDEEWIEFVQSIDMNYIELNIMCNIPLVQKLFRPNIRTTFYPININKVYTNRNVFSIYKESSLDAMWRVDVISERIKKNAILRKNIIYCDSNYTRSIIIRSMIPDIKVCSLQTIKYVMENR